jgi:hypothetical protein
MLQKKHNLPSDSPTHHRFSSIMRRTFDENAEERLRGS